jgi:hypothetical protein
MIDSAALVHGMIAARGVCAIADAIARHSEATINYTTFSVVTTRTLGGLGWKRLLITHLTQ